MNKLQIFCPLLERDVHLSGPFSKDGQISEFDENEDISLNITGFVLNMTGLVLNGIYWPLNDFENEVQKTKKNQKAENMIAIVFESLK